MYILSNYEPDISASRALAAEQGNPIPERPLVFLKPTTAYVTPGHAIKVHQKWIFTMPPISLDFRISPDAHVIGTLNLPIVRLIVSFVRSIPSLAIYLCGDI